MEEVWKDIEGFEGLYQVSNLGNVRSLDRYVSHLSGGECLKKGRILKPYIDKDGYKKVILCKYGEKRLQVVHRLVAQTFIPNINNLPFINHKDENKTNNRVDNLEWCTQKYNCNFGTRNERIIQNRIGKTARRPIVQLTKQCELVGEYESAMEAYRQTGISQGSISNCCRGLQKYTRGFIWKYK